MHCLMLSVGYVRKKIWLHFCWSDLVLGVARHRQLQDSLKWMLVFGTCALDGTL